MSAYGHQMEGEYSSPSLSSRESSEMGSHYVMESGFYMTSFAATIFIAGLVTVGVLLITLLIALTVMLQSCESRSAGLVEISRPNDSYNYCKILSLQAELNGLDVDDLPEICKTATIQYIKQGHYARDLNLTVAIAEHYFDSVKPLEGGMDLVLIDIDDFFPSSSHYTDPLQSRFSQFGCYDCVKEANNLKHFFILKLYIRLRAGGWSLILLSRRPEKQRNDTIENLIYAGYGGWSSLIMRSHQLRVSCACKILYWFFRQSKSCNQSLVVPCLTYSPLWLRGMH
ncbi:uncharacterized protein At2g39920 isoform X2 [Diospyros lotus]|uniref:uncharacterized protein At2g39920 isoform X2 n=1 Tax=Diospyros lotus TaxID=55363 RepID=UPI00225115EE|nr:uncharacterized protein At2g39920 isoform X2 [Diospyros lotus]